MALEFDEKGKYFTEIITKDVIQCHIQAQAYTIIGFVHVRKGDRLSDEVNAGNNFLAITDAEIRNLAGEVLYKAAFMVVNREHIVWLMPLKEREEKPD